MVVVVGPGPITGPEVVVVVASVEGTVPTSGADVDGIVLGNGFRNGSSRDEHAVNVSSAATTSAVKRQDRMLGTLDRRRGHADHPATIAATVSPTSVVVAPIRPAASDGSVPATSATAASITSPAAPWPVC